MAQQGFLPPISGYGSNDPNFSQAYYSRQLDAFGGNGSTNYQFPSFDSTQHANEFSGLNNFSVDPANLLPDASILQSFGNGGTQRKIPPGTPGYGLKDIVNPVTGIQSQIGLLKPGLDLFNALNSFNTNRKLIGIAKDNLALSRTSANNKVESYRNIQRDNRDRSLALGSRDPNARAGSNAQAAYEERVKNLKNA